MCHAPKAKPLIKMSVVSRKSSARLNSELEKGCVAYCMMKMNQKKMQRTKLCSASNVARKTSSSVRRSLRSVSTIS